MFDIFTATWYTPLCVGVKTASRRSQPLSHGTAWTVLGTYTTDANGKIAVEIQHLAVGAQFRIREIVPKRRRKRVRLRAVRYRASRRRWIGRRLRRRRRFRDG